MAFRCTTGPVTLGRTRWHATIRASLLLAGLIFLTAYALGQGPEEKEKVSGVVINSVTGSPVARAMVQSTDDSFGMLTDSSGHFEFNLPKPSSNGAVSPERQNFWASFGPQTNPMLVRGSAGTELWLNAHKPGYLGSAGGRAQVVSSASEEIVMELVPEALIEGRVTLSTGEPALGVNVELLARQVREGIPRWVPRSIERANSNGEFRFSELQAGSYKVVTRELLDNDPASALPGGQTFGFAPVFYPGVADFGAAGTIELAPGQTVQADLALTHQPYYPVKIPVANGEADGGVNVHVYLQGKRGPGYSLGYNAAQHQIEGSLPNGNYAVEAFAYGPGSGAGAVNLHVAGAPAEGTPLAFTRNGSVTFDVKQEFTDTGWSGSSSWSDGKHNYTFHGPRAFLFVGVEPVDDFEMSRGAALRPPTGPNDESLVLENIPPGRYWVRLTSGRGYVAEATAGGVDLLHEPLTVDAGANIQVEVRMRDDFAQLEGTVTGVTPQPGVAPGWLYCVPVAESPGQFQQVVISADGTIGTLTIAPGSYQMLAFSTQQNELPYRDAEAMKAYEGKGPIVHVGSGQKTSVQVPINAEP